MPCASYLPAMATRWVVTAGYRGCCGYDGYCGYCGYSDQSSVVAGNVVHAFSLHVEMVSQLM